MSRDRRRHDHCLNCEAPLAANFCGQCGQENSDYRVSLRRLVADLGEELFQLESRLWRSLWTLVRRPGLLTADYNAGRRVRWTSPLRLYIIASVVYFFVSSLLPGSKVHLDFGDEGSAQVSKDLATPHSWLERRIYDRLGMHSAADAGEMDVRAKALLAQNIPKVMALLVPLFALLTWALFRRPRLYYVEHLMLALHLHAVAFFAALVMALNPVDLADLGVWLLVVVWLALALRRLFGQRWWLLAAKLLLIVTVYSILIAGGLLVALLI